MGRPTGLIGVLAVSLFWGCGCSAPGGPALTGLFHKPHRKKSADQTTRIAKTNPLRKPGDPRQSSASPTPTSTDLSASESHHSIGGQATTDRRSLIRSIVETEMHGASPSEREAMFDNVKDLDPAFARQVLSMNRLVRQMGQRAPGQQRLRTADATAGRSADAPIPNLNPRGGAANPMATARSAQTGITRDTASVVPTAGTETPLSPAAAFGATPWNPNVSPSRAATIATPRFPLRARNGTATERSSGQRLAAASITAGRALPGDRHDSDRPAAPFDGNTGRIGSAAAIEDPTSNLNLAEWHDGLTRLIARAETAAARNRPGGDASPEAERDYIEKQVYLRMLYLMNDQRARSIEPIYGIDAADQEFWQQMFWAIAGYFDRRTIPDPRKRATETLASLQKAVHDLQPKAELKLANAAFCHKITSYGNYETFDRNEFRPGRPVLLYVEVENFASERTADNRFRTLLKSTIEIMDPAGNVLQKIPFPATEDLCRNYRRDYFHSYEFSIPETRTIGFGPHKVRLTVQDEISGQLATYTLNFNVTGN